MGTGRTATTVGYCHAGGAKKEPNTRPVTPPKSGSSVRFVLSTTCHARYLQIHGVLLTRPSSGRDHCLQRGMRLLRCLYLHLDGNFHADSRSPPSRAPPLPPPPEAACLGCVAVPPVKRSPASCQWSPASLRRFLAIDAIQCPPAGRELQRGPMERTGDMQWDGGWRLIAAPRQRAKRVVWFGRLEGKGEKKAGKLASRQAGKHVHGPLPQLPGSTCPSFPVDNGG